MTREKYNPQKIEKKWQKIWADQNIFEVKEESKKKKQYILDMFPYPSSDGLHVGHPEGYTATDIVARFRRMKYGENILHPMGFDAFGLPAENYAIKMGKNPKDITGANIKNFIRQLKMLGFSYDWSRMVVTCEPDYYRWTQWMFCQLYTAGLAYKKQAPVNWCESCQTVLAREQVVDGKCERCKSQVIQKNLAQWFFKITDYADELLTEVDKLDWPEPIKAAQRNWIGRSEGAIVSFKVVILNEAKRSEESREMTGSLGLRPQDDIFLPVFTTRPDTLFGATFMVVAPEHEIISKFKSQISNLNEIKKYIESAQKKSELERTDLNKNKTGVEIKGIKAINPVNGKEIPIWVADYVLMGYGTGAIMAVPAHDERDWEFAKKYNLEIVPVIQQSTANSQQSTILVIHGFGGHSKENWFPWFKKEFEQKGYKVLIPNLPNTNQPKLEEWLESLKQLKNEIKGDLIIIGHSLGTPAACKFIEKNNLPVKKLVLIGPVGKNCVSFEGLKKAGFNENDFDMIKEFVKEDFDWKLLNKLVEEKVIYLSKNDPYITLEAEKDYKPLNAKVTIFENKGHFNEGAGILELPEIVSDIEGVFTDINSGKMINSGEFNGLRPDECIQKITTWLEKKGLGKKAINYKLRDWLISRQRYWGAPIPIIYCPDCGEQLVSEKDLPVELPDDVDFRPKGESPLARSVAFHKNVKCPKCGRTEGVRRESDTMDTFVCSSWYFLRYADPQNKKQPFDNKKVKYWLPVDLYVGGAEHAVLHLMYARFFAKALCDMGQIDFREPFLKLRNQGMILAEDGRKMSKSLGNVINPDEVVEKFGADTFRMYEMFMGPLEDAKPWNTKSMIGVYRFLERVWNLQTGLKTQITEQKNRKLDILLNQTIKKVGEDVENMKFNTAIAQMMILVNELEKQSALLVIHYSLLITILSPFAPHLAEEVWQKLGHKKSILFETWPEYDPKLVVADEIKLAVQVNGKVRDEIVVAADISEADVTKMAMKSEKVQKWLEGEQPKKVIYVKGKLVSIVV